MEDYEITDALDAFNTNVRWIWISNQLVPGSGASLFGKQVIFCPSDEKGFAGDTLAEAAQQHAFHCTLHGKLRTI